MISSSSWIIWIMPKKIKKPNIDGIQFDSWEEWEVYCHLRDGTLWTLTWIKELNKYKLIDASPAWITLFEWFKAWPFTQRARKYKWDFTCKDNNNKIIHLEYKSKWSESKPDYRLRRFLVLLSKKLKFVELIKQKKGVYVLRRYF